MIYLKKSSKWNVISEINDLVVGSLTKICSLNDLLYFIGGFENKASKQSWKFSPSTKLMEKIADMNTEKLLPH